MQATLPICAKEKNPQLVWTEGPATQYSSAAFARSLNVGNSRIEKFLRKPLGKIKDLPYDP